MPHDLNWDGCRNVRDLGGFVSSVGTTRVRAVVRGDNARELTPAGWPLLARVGGAQRRRAAPAALQRRAA